MPFIEVKAIEGVFTHEEKQEIIKRITDIFVSMMGENLRQHTMVVVSEIKQGEWGIGGQGITADMVHAMSKAIPA